MTETVIYDPLISAAKATLIAGSLCFAAVEARSEAAFDLGLRKCWNVSALGREAKGISVTLGFEIGRDTKPVAQSIRLMSHSGGSKRAVRQAYEAARRAILRCGARGFDLPLDEYDQWREAHVSFHASRKNNK